MFLAPDAAHANPPPAWMSCGEGCLEMDVTWPRAEDFRMYAHSGASDGTRRYLSYWRYLDVPGPIETQILELPTQNVVFNSVQPSIADGWKLYPFGESLTGSFIGLLDADVGAKARYYYFHQDYTTANPLLPTFDVNTSLSPTPFRTISSKLWAMAPGYASWGWYPLSGGELAPAWLSSNGSTLSALTAWGEHVFFATTAQDVLVWDAVNGTQPLVSFPTPSAGGACCVTTDGVEITWYQGSDYQGDGTYGTVEMMASPFATTAAALQPRVVRPSSANHIKGGSTIMAGGHDAAAIATGVIAVTRLSDGHYWVIPSPPNLQLGQPLYVDQEELAVSVHSVGSSTPASQLSIWNILRLSIAALGEPLPPGSGFEVPTTPPNLYATISQP